MGIFQMRANLIGALYSELPQAEAVITKLRQAGLSSDELTLLTDATQFPESTFPQVDGMFLEQQDSNVEQGTGTGAVIGGVGGALAGLSVVVLPGAGPALIIGSVLLSAAVGMSLGALTGGTVALLVKLGFQEDEAKDLASHLEAGYVLVLAQARSVHPDLIRGIMNAEQPIQIQERVRY